jgi:hypothetical protein
MSETSLMTTMLLRACLNAFGVTLIIHYLIKVIKYIKIRTTQAGGLEGKALQEHVFVARFASRAGKTSNKKQCGACGPQPS